MLGRAMLVSCEVAVEYYLALIHSPQVSPNRSMLRPITDCPLPPAVAQQSRTLLPHS